MLALTENVTEIVKHLTDEVPAVAGIRIATEPDGQSLSISPADQAAPSTRSSSRTAPRSTWTSPPPRSWTTRSWTAAWTQRATSSSPWASRPDRTSDSGAPSP